MNNYQDYRRILKSDWLWAVLTSELHKGQWMVPSNWTVNPTARVPLNVFQLFFFTASKKLTIILCTNIESGLPVVGCCFRTLRLRRIFIAKSNKGVVGLHIKSTVAPFLSYQDVIELSPHEALSQNVHLFPIHFWNRVLAASKLLSTIKSSKYRKSSTKTPLSNKPPPSNKPPLFRRRKLISLPLSIKPPLLYLLFANKWQTISIIHDCKTSCELIQDGLFTN